MKLTADEIATVAALVAETEKEHPRTAPGTPGCRAQPLSLAGLIAERRKALHRD